MSGLRIDYPEALHGIDVSVYRVWFNCMSPLVL